MRLVDYGWWAAVGGLRLVGCGWCAPFRELRLACCTENWGFDSFYKHRLAGPGSEPVKTHADFMWKVTHLQSHGQILEGVHMSDIRSA